MLLPPKQPLSPLDGRYHETVSALTEFLSENALNRARIRVEIEWLIYLTDKKLVHSQPLSSEKQTALREIASSFNQQSITELSRLESVTHHDVKAVEYFIRQQLSRLKLDSLAELVHFGCTSEDINNLAYAVMIREAVTTVWLPAFHQVISVLAQQAIEYRNDAMLARTHGQAATPTTLGKELGVFVYRLERILKEIEEAEYLGKFSGATGTFAAHQIAEPEQDWPTLAKKFVESFGLTYNPLTTQIESHDWQATLYQRIAHANRILHNVCTDIWSYISLDYFSQIPTVGATGSSTMPHKINPIAFENAEANCELSNAILDSLSHTLVTSRLQRDLTDSSSQRNIGVALGHSLLALSNITKGLGQVTVNREQLAQDLEQNWQVLAEAIQTVIRSEIVAGRSSITDPYAVVKELTRGKKIDHSRLVDFVSKLDIGSDAKKRLLSLTPASYIGLASELVENIRKNQ